MGRIEPAFKPAFLLYVFLFVQFYAPIARSRETHCKPAYQGGAAASAGWGNASHGVEAVREVQVQTSGIDAESSRNGGGMSKRGGGSFHFPLYLEDSKRLRADFKCILKVVSHVESKVYESEGCTYVHFLCVWTAPPTADCSQDSADLV